MDFKQIKELIAKLNDSNISEIKVADKDFKIHIRTKAYTEAVSKGKVAVASMPMAAPAPVMQAASAAPVAAQATSNEEEAAPAASGEDVIKAPMIGTFYRSASPEKPPFVKVGDRIEKGQTICIIEAMKLFNEIEAEKSGTITKILIDDATPVEYDQPIMEIDPA